MGLYGNEIKAITENNIIISLDVMTKELNESVFSDNIINESAKEKIKSIVDTIVNKISDLIRIIKEKLLEVANAVKIRTIGKGFYPLLTLKPSSDIELDPIRPSEILLTKYDEEKMKKSEEIANSFLSKVFGDSEDEKERAKHAVDYLFLIGTFEVKNDDDKKFYVENIKKLNDRMKRSIEKNIEVLEEFKGTIAKYNTSAWITNDDETKVKIVAFNVKIANIVIKKIRTMINLMIYATQFKKYKQMCKFAGIDPEKFETIKEEE